MSKFDNASKAAVTGLVIAAFYPVGGLFL